MKYKLWIAIILCSMTFLFTEESKLQKETIWIDVRTVEEFESGHLEKALHIPYQMIAEKIEAVTKDKNALIKVYCKVGGRAGIAKKTLEKMGYKNVINAGGYSKLSKSKKHE